MSTKCVIDTEEATSEALLDVFPEITIQGCIYHDINSIHRKAKQLGHAKKKRPKKLLVW